MASDRIQRRIEHLLDEADEAFAERNWVVVRDNAQDVLLLDAENREAQTFLAAAEQALATGTSEASPSISSPPSTPQTGASDSQPTSFANGRYQVKRFLGEGGKKKVYLAHDGILDRDVALAVLKSESLDDRLTF